MENDYIFKQSNLKEKHLDADQMKLLGTITKNFTIDYEFVRLNKQLLKDKKDVVFNKFEKNSTFKEKNNRKKNDRDWHKTFVDPEERERLSITSLEDILIGVIHLKEISYDLFPITDKDHVMIRQTEAHLSCGTTSEGELTKVITERTYNPYRTTEVVRVATVVTQDVKKNWGYSGWYTGNIPFYEFITYLAVDNAIDILENSVVTNVIIDHISTIDVLAGYTEDGARTSSILEDVIYLDHLDEYRNAYQADIVMVLIDNPRNDQDAWGEAGGTIINATRAVTAIQVDRANVEYTYAHELFHLFTCQHQLDQAEFPNKPFEFAFTQGWTLPQKSVFTVMWAFFGANDDEPIPYLSNPDVDYDPGFWWDEKPIGRSDRDNARSVEENASSVGSYRSGSSSTMRAYINKDDDVFEFPSGNIFLLPITREGTSQAITSVTYGISQNGISYSSSSLPFPGFAWSYNSNTFTMACSATSILEGEDIYIRATVNTSSHSFTAYYKFEVISGSGFRNDDEVTTRSIEEISIYPNPVDDILNIDGLNNQGTLVEIYNIEGKKVLSQMVNDHIDLSILVTGNYFIRIPTHNLVYTINKQ